MLWASMSLSLRNVAMRCEARGELDIVKPTVAIRDVRKALKHAYADAKQHT
jgi:hypothetical protein